MKKNRKEVLSWEEGAELLGAEAPEDIGQVRLDPIGMRVMASRIGKRLVSKGGRPTDASWSVSRKVPMKQATWDKLKEMARSFADQDVHVSPGQVAAFALELGLPELVQEAEAQPVAAVRESGFACYEFDEESKDEAKILCGVIDEEGLW